MAEPLMLEEHRKTILMMLSLEEEEAGWITEEASPLYPAIASWTDLGYFFREEMPKDLSKKNMVLPDTPLGRTLRPIFDKFPEPILLELLEAEANVRFFRLTPAGRAHFKELLLK